jgi:hypothetical protein
MQERKKKHSQTGCVQATPGDGLSSLVFQNKPFLSAFGVVQTSMRKHFFFGNAAEGIYFSSCLAGKMGRKNVMTPIRAGDLARREHSLRTPAPSHAHDDTESGHKTMICSSVTGYMAAFWLVFSQVFGKHFRFEQTTVHPVGSLSEGRA